MTCTITRSPLIERTKSQEMPSPESRSCSMLLKAKASPGLPSDRFAR